MFRILLPLGVFLILLAGIVNARPSAEEDQQVQWGKEVEGSRFGIAPLQPSCRYDQPVKVRMTIKNVGQEASHVLITDLMHVYRFDVRLPDGKPAPLTLEGNRMMDDTNSTGVSFHKLEPGEFHTGRLTLNRYYDMTLLGEYTVTIYRKVLPSGGGTK